jgi:hypothetical protein
MTEKTITVPGREELARRLTAYNDSAHVQDGFHSRLLKIAGQRKTPEGLAMALLLAYAEYTSGLPRIVQVQLVMAMPWYIGLLTDDLEARQTTRAYLVDADLLSASK